MFYKCKIIERKIFCIRSQIGSYIYIYKIGTMTHTRVSSLIDACRIYRTDIDIDIVYIV